MIARASLELEAKLALNLTLEEEESGGDRWVLRVGGEEQMVVMAMHGRVKKKRKYRGFDYGLDEKGLSFVQCRRRQILSSL